MDICKYTPLTKEQILSTIKSQKVCKIGTNSDDKININPMWYTFDFDNITNSLFFYFILMHDGQQFHNIKNTNISCVFIDRYTGITSNLVYESIVAHGKNSILSKISDTKYITKKFIDKYGSNFKICNMSNTCFLKVEIDTISGRAY